jgi:mediator of RNA polymerase II transcription subunit 12
MTPASAGKLSKPPLRHPISEPRPAPGSRASSSSSSNQPNENVKDEDTTAAAKGRGHGTSSSSHSRTTSRDLATTQPSTTTESHTLFPPRPIQPTLKAQSRSIIAPPSATVVEATNAPLEPPPIAKIYPHGLPADFCPWKGSNVEDNISEQTIKNGFQNKSLITNESNTARPSVWSQLRKTGPSFLSSLFVHLLEKRQSQGRITTTSTFKLPPRLTMTTTRREAFLRELADPTWPLRKLTRSVPHGIGGKVLLELCLDKLIPISRAVWLAKCIGAHEIRILRRKATTIAVAQAAEAKWVKEWTIAVENLLRTTLNDITQSHWKIKADYLLRLSAQLFSSRLIDEDHFLDWILATSESNMLDHLPIWLLLVRTYFKPLRSNRFRGRRLAEILFNCLVQLGYSKVDDERFRSVFLNIQDLLCKLSITSPSSLLFTQNWHQYSDILQSILKTTTNPTERLSFAQVIRRNERLVCKFEVTQSPDPVEKLLQLLDLESGKTQASRLAVKCFSIVEDSALISSVAVRWASSIYKDDSSCHRIYTAVGVLRSFKTITDLSELVWTIVEEFGHDTYIDFSKVFHIVLELTRTNDISISGLLKRLITTGPFSEGSDSQLSPLVSLIEAIPDQILSPGVRDLRASLLEPLGLSQSIETDQFLNVKSTISDILVNSTNSSNVLNLSSLASVHKLTRTQKYRLGLWLKQEIVPLYIYTPSDGLYEDDLAFAKRLEAPFLVLRHILENIQEFSVLSSMIKILLMSSNQRLLTFLSQTIRSRYLVYGSLGTVNGFLDQLMSKYEFIRTHIPLEKSFSVSLLDLCSILSTKNSWIPQIKQDIVRCDQIFAAMCSPASELAIESPAPATDIDADLDRVLSSGTTMDQVMFGRIFKQITNRVEELFSMPPSCEVPIGRWLSSLQCFDHTFFNALSGKWISILLGSEQGQKLLYHSVLPLLIGSSCYSWSEFLNLYGSIDKSNFEDETDAHLCCLINNIFAFLPTPIAVAEYSIAVSRLSSDRIILTLKTGNLSL